MLTFGSCRRWFWRVFLASAGSPTALPPASMSNRPQSRAAGRLAALKRLGTFDGVHETLKPHAYGRMLTMSVGPLHRLHKRLLQNGRFLIGIDRGFRSQRSVPWGPL